MRTRRLSPDTEWEVKLGYPGILVCGVDEVGRGCLAGPVVASAVVLPDVLDYSACPWLKKVSDSKLLSPETRCELAPLIQQWAKAWATGLASVEEIDAINIHHASQLAMVRAVEGMGLPIQHVIVDGKFSLKNLSCASTPVIKGDQKCLSVACASILAKVWRDDYMVELSRVFPDYGFGEHKGYPTPIHFRALDEFGICREHRRSFSPIQCRLMRSDARLF